MYRYKAKLLGLEFLPENNSVGEFIKFEKTSSVGMPREILIDKIQKKLLDAHICTGERNYYRAYNLLVRLRARERS